MSVIIPCYNAARTIGTTLRSIADQTLLPVEVICVDDCSRDDTVEVIRAFAATCPAPEIILHRMPQNGGPSLARNAGWSMARGDHVAFLDSDDIWHPRKLEIQMRVMQETGSFGSSHARKVDLSLSPPPAVEVPAPQPLSFTGLLYWSRIITSSVVLRNSPDYRFPEDMRYSEDFKLWCRILADGHRFMLIDVPLSGIVGGHDAAPGLSAAVLKMERGKLAVFRGLHREGRISWPRLASVIAFSNLKFVIRRIQGLF
ncbi:glycosyltransferase [Microvirga tunisiensis]|uniref:Glycosyltransferase n=1 Tax=Pannonibacter tanglangensis TaxID=2750084 RepID=A0A7X5F0S8_9HYPH|nr:glycosyltransferase [Pannonibacter sp. XCT-53]